MDKKKEVRSHRAHGENKCIIEKEKIHIGQLLKKVITIREHPVYKKFIRFLLRGPLTPIVNFGRSYFGS